MHARKIILVNLLVISTFFITAYIANSINIKYSVARDFEYSLPTNINSWKYDDKVHTVSLTPSIISADYTKEGVYTSNAGNVDIYTYVYTNASGGKEIIHFNNVMFRTKYWTMAKKSKTRIKFNNSNYLLNEYLVSKGNSSRIIRYFYLINGKYIVSAYKVKLYETLVKLRGLDMDSRLFVFSIDESGDYVRSSNVLNSVIAKVMADLKV